MTRLHYLAVKSRLDEFITELVNLPLTAPGPVTAFVKRFADFGLFDQRLLQALTKTFYSTNRQELEELIGPRLTRYFKLQDAERMREILRSRETTGTPYYVDDFGAVDREYEKAVEAGEVKRVVEKTVVPHLFALFQATWDESDAKVRDWGLTIFRTKLAQTWSSTGPNLILSASGSGRTQLPKPPKELPVEMALEHLIKHQHRRRICKNAKCQRPAFLVKRHTQKYCSEQCAQAAERETKRRWWAEHGADWRTKKLQTATRKKSRRKPNKQKKGK